MRLSFLTLPTDERRLYIDQAAIRRNGSIWSHIFFAIKMGFATFLPVVTFSTNLTPILSNRDFV